MIKIALNLFALILLSYTAAGQPGPVQNNKSRVLLSLNGKWNYIVDPYENGFYDYRREAFDASASGKGGFFDARGVQIPVAVMAYPDEIYQAPQTWAERAYPKLLRYTRLPKGTHFAAWEQPQTFVAELRAGFSSLRTV